MVGFVNVELSGVQSVGPLKRSDVISKNKHQRAHMEQVRLGDWSRLDLTIIVDPDVT